MAMLVLVLVALFTMAASEGPPFFRTNVDEYVNYPLKFTHPIPSWLRGSLIRNGIGRFEFGTGDKVRKVTNGLDAFAKLSSWRFTGNGTAFFSTKMIQSDSYRKSVAMDDIAPYLLGAPTDPRFTLEQFAEAFINGLDNMNVNVLNYTDASTGTQNFVAVSDCWKAYEFNPKTLDSIQAIDPDIPGASVFDAPLPLSSGHPLPEPGTSNHLTFVGVNSLIPGGSAAMRLIRVMSGNKRELIASVKVDRLSYLHSFPVTQNYAILPSLPLFIDLSKLKNMSPLEAFTYDPNAKVKFHVINIKTGFYKTIESENLFYLHCINAYETDSNEIVIDLSVYKDGGALLTLNMTRLSDDTLRAKAETPVLKRVTLDMTTETATVTLPKYNSSLPGYISYLEYPTINENFRFKSYCYIYGISFNIDHTDFLKMAIVKKDLCTGNDKYWYSDNKYYNEAWFEPRPGATEEDDGVLVLPIFDKSTFKTNVTIFDAKDLTVITSAPLPTNNPFGTHGRFFKDVY